MFWLRNKKNNFQLHSYLGARLWLSSSDFFLKLTFSNEINSETLLESVSNCLDPDQDRQNVGPDLGPKCLQRLSADDKSQRLHEKS